MYFIAVNHQVVVTNNHNQTNKRKLNQTKFRRFTQVQVQAPRQTLGLNAKLTLP